MSHGGDLGTPSILWGCETMGGMAPPAQGEQGPPGRDREVTHEDKGDAETKEPFNAGLGVRVPGAVGLPSSQLHNKHHRHSEREAGGWQVCHLLLGTVTLSSSLCAQPQSACAEAEKKSSGSSPRSPSRSSAGHSGMESVSFVRVWDRGIAQDGNQPLFFTGQGAFPPLPEWV